MAKHENLKALFTAIATSIRNKTGGTDPIVADDFPEVIDGITTGGGADKIQRYIELNGNSAQYMFYKFNGTSVDELLDGVDTSNITDASYMFYNSNYLTDVPLFDTSKVTNMSCMLALTPNLVSVPLFNTSKVTNMNSMLSQSFAITSVPLFDTSNVTDMGSMFSQCVKLTSVPLFNTSKVTNMSYMFQRGLALLVVSALDMRSVTNANRMFSECSALTECWIRNIKTALQVGYATESGHLLTLESLLHLCKECRKTTSSLTLTMGTANLAKLEGIYVKLIDITDEMRAEDDLIDEKYPFVVCESTDEGAMTIADYMALKKWSLA